MEISFKRPDGKEARGYLAMPEDGEKSPAIVLIHEWWGLNDQVRHTADRLSEEGFRVFVPDLYGGKNAKIGDVQGATALMQQLDMDDAVAQTVRGAVQHLKHRGGEGTRCAVVGFCMGGAVAIKAAVEVRELDAAVSFYAVKPNEIADVRQIRVPFQAHVSRVDEFTPQEQIDAFERNLKSGGVNFEFHRYGAQHAFMNEQRPDKHDPVAARAAWDATLRFLESTIGGHAATGTSRPGHAPIP
ncbi:dienelactone hydrolase family protein [Vulgatibacter sp.]|uniref:dienelactone hydrolase family protein n=1 Tax=Vulgatibacter sp. TaxID=1971226 RepID=UPI0035615C31